MTTPTAPVAIGAVTITITPAAHRFIRRDATTFICPGFPMNPAALLNPANANWSFWLWSGLAFAAAFLVTFALSLAIVGFLLVRLPATYFLNRHERGLWIDRHPVVRWLGIILKNGLGLGVIALGAVLSLPGVPGQGVLTILLGVMLLDFPGKRNLERRLLGAPRVLDGVNRLRARYGRPPLVLEEAHGETDPGTP